MALVWLLSLIPAAPAPKGLLGVETEAGFCRVGESSSGSAADA